MSEKISAAAMDRLFRQARSFNGYIDKPVAEEQLHEIWDLMKFGPTSANLHPIRIVWCCTKKAREKLASLALETNAAKIIQAPVTAIIGMDYEFYDKWEMLMPYKDVSSWFIGNDELIANTAFRNSSMQGGYFILAARAVGLDIGPMSGFDNAAVDAEFFAGTKVKSNFICTLGYGDPATVFDRLPRPNFSDFTRIA